jgi:hypothetical protein
MAPDVSNKNSEEVVAKDSFEKLANERAAIPDERVKVVNCDASQAVSVVLAVVTRLRGLRDDIVKALLDFNIERFDELEDRALALQFANTDYLLATKPPDNLKEQYEEGLKLRNVLHADINTLAVRGLVNGDALKDYSGNVGYKNVAVDLNMVARFLETNWPNIQGKCAVTTDEIAHALQLAIRLLRGASARELSPEQLAQMADDRNRAFSLLMEAYDDARRAVQYIRYHENDADTIAPNIYSFNNPSTAKKSSAKPAEELSQPTNSAVQTTTHSSTPTATNSLKTTPEIVANDPFLR